MEGPSHLGLLLSFPVLSPDFIHDALGVRLHPPTPVIISHRCPQLHGHCNGHPTSASWKMIRPLLIRLFLKFFLFFFNPASVWFSS